MLRGVGKSLKPRLHVQNGQLVAFSTRSWANEDKANLRKPAPNAGQAYTFGLRPQTKRPWSAVDERFDKTSTPRFGETIEVKEVRLATLRSKEVAPHLKKLELEDEGDLPEGAMPTILVSNLRADTRKSHLLDLCWSAGLLLLDIASPTQQTTTCRFRFDTAREAVKLVRYLEEGGFCEGAVEYTFKGTAERDITRFLTIRNYQDTPDKLKDMIKGQGSVVVHLIQAETLAGKRRVDAYIGFKNTERASAAKKALDKAHFTGKSAASIRFILQEIYYNVIEQPTPNFTEEELSKPPVPDNSDTPSLPSIPRGPYRTIFLGNVPPELLKDKTAIIERFSAYGSISDVRIPMLNGQVRGIVYLEFIRQEDADMLYHDLTIAPLFLYNRKVRVDYSEGRSAARAALSLPGEALSDRGVYIGGVLPEITYNRLDLYRTVRAFGEVVDMRVLFNEGGGAPVFVDFLEPESAAAIIAAGNSGELQSLGPDVFLTLASHPKEPPWVNMDYEPTDVLRVWNLPVRALWTEDMLREAFNHNNGLIHIRTPKRDGWPIGVVYLHYKSVEAAREILEWVTSDPEQPVTFFGRTVRMHFSNEHREGHARGRWQSRDSMSSREGESPRGRTRDEGWKSTNRSTRDGQASQRGDLDRVRENRRKLLETWNQSAANLPTISNRVEE